MTAGEIIDVFISFFEKRGHTRIPNSPLVPENDPTTLFTSSGMQPLIPYLLGQTHPQGKRLVDVQNCFRAQDIDEVGDNRHTTFFRMLGNWSLGDYFKNEETPWLWEFLTKGLGLPKEKLFITVFNGYNNIEKDNESFDIWAKILKKEGFDPDTKIFFAGVDKNWWSRSGVPDNMPMGEPGGPDTEVYYRFDDVKHNDECEGDSPVLCECGKYLEIANSVFMQYVKKDSGFEDLPQQNVDFGGGLERLLAAVENKPDIFQTGLFSPIIRSIEKATASSYKNNEKNMRIVADHLVAAIFIASNNITPSNKDQGYILRRLIRRAVDSLQDHNSDKITAIIEEIIGAYKETDPNLATNYEFIKLTILEEVRNYRNTLTHAKRHIEKTFDIKISYEGDDSAKASKEISAEDAFILYSTYGLSPSQIRSLGYTFNDRQFSRKMEEHKKLSRAGAGAKFKGGLADTSELTVMGHTATHLLHQALRDVLGDKVHQTGSNITTERIRFDFNYEDKLTDEKIKKVEDIVNGKIKENLPVHFEIMPLEKAKELGAIGLFDEKYQQDVKVYFVGDYSKEFCGGPHVDFTGKLKRFKIIKQENIGHGQKRLYAKVND